MPVADELIAGVRLRRKRVEAALSWVVTDQLHPAKIIPTATPRAAQLCVVTLEDTAGNRSRWKQRFFRSVGISVGSQTQGDREAEGTKEGQ